LLLFHISVLIDIEKLYELTKQVQYITQSYQSATGLPLHPTVSLGLLDLWHSMEVSGWFRASRATILKFH